MKANYPVCIAETLKWEIGPGRPHANSNYPGDRRTRDGVTQASYNLWRHQQGLPMRDVFQMQDSERDAIYKHNYADLIDFDSLPSGVDMIALDCVINGSHIKQWLNETTRLAPAARIHSIHLSRIGYWRHCPQWIRAHIGWLRRENDILAKSLALAAAK